MRPLPLLLTLSFLPLLGCQNEQKKEEEKKTKEAKKKNAQDDPAFQAFLGRLRTAAQKRDRVMLQSLMTSNFGYTWDNVQPGDSVYTYWDLHNLWPKLNTVLRLPFVPNLTGPGEFYMVAVEEPESGGYAAGMQVVNGSWRFAYFVPPPPPDQAQ